jgi:serine/threonine protein kinase
VVSKSLIFQLTLGISYLHSLSPAIAHRDINPTNVMIDTLGCVKLIDFGTAWICGELQKDGKMVQHVASSSENYDLGNRRTRSGKDLKEAPGDMCFQVSTG